MTLEQAFYASQIAASVGVIVSLGFVGYQIRENTAALQRDEHNSTMAQWTVIRMAIAQHREIAELMTSGLQGGKALDAADQLRLEQMLNEYSWAAFHIWDRTQRGIFPQGTFAMTGGAMLCEVLKTPLGEAWWRSERRIGLLPAFVADVDAMLASRNAATARS
jgi:hypothetical protein